MGNAGWDQFASAMPELARLSPTMTSRKLQALAFIRHFFARWGQSPTLSEISAAVHVSRKRAHELVHQLATEKALEVVAGKPRGIRLMDSGEELSEPEILARLSALGWTIGDGSQVIHPPDAGGFTVALFRGVTEKGLLTLPVLDHKAADIDRPVGTSGSDEEAQTGKGHTNGRAALG